MAIVTTGFSLTSVSADVLGGGETDAASASVSAAGGDERRRLVEDELR